MTRHLPRALTRSAFIAAAALAVGAAGTVTAPGATAATPAGTPKLKLIAATSAVTLDRYEGEPGVTLDLGTYVTVDGGPQHHLPQGRPGRHSRRPYGDRAQVRPRGRPLTPTRRSPTGLRRHEVAPVRARNSLRERASVRSRPSMLEVMVLEPPAWTPRRVMQVCSASITTPTPFGSRWV